MASDLNNNENLKKAINAIKNLITNHNSSTTSHNDIRTDLSNKAEKTHSHTKSQITDFPTIPSANDTATNIKQNGTQAAGSLTSFARADHVHPIDTGRAPRSHTHTKSEVTDFPTIPSANDTATNIKINGTQAAGSLDSFARADHVHPIDTGRAPRSHTHTSLETQTVPANADFNDYKTVGVYKCGSNANVQTMSNTPWGDKPSGGQAFVMIVLDHAGVSQIVRPYNRNDYNMYMRNFYNNAWGDWISVYTSGNSHTHPYVPLAGGTMTGRLFIPNYGDANNQTGNVPVSQRIQDTTATKETTLKGKTSFIGSIYPSDKVWYNVISARHGNGQGDGLKYGMLLSSPMTTEGDLSWKQHINDTWKNGKVILDSSNYGKYVDTYNDTKSSGTVSLASGFTGTVKYYQRGHAVVVNINELKYNASTTMKTFGSIPFNSIFGENLEIAQWHTATAKTQVKLTNTGTLQFYTNDASYTFTGQLVAFVDS